MRRSGKTPHEQPVQQSEPVVVKVPAEQAARERMRGKPVGKSGLELLTCMLPLRETTEEKPGFPLQQELPSALAERGYLALDPAAIDGPPYQHDIERIHVRHVTHTEVCELGLRLDPS